MAEDTPDYAAMKPSQLAAEVKALEERMYRHAQDLEFEAAARLRDQIHRIREASLQA